MDAFKYIKKERECAKPSVMMTVVKVVHNTVFVMVLMTLQIMTSSRL